MAFGKRGLSVVRVAVGVTVFCWMLLLAAAPSGAQTNEDCSDPRSIDTFTGSDDRITDEFRVTGDRFRIRFDTTTIDDDEQDETLDLTVRNADGGVEDTISISEAGSGSEIISAGPGRFSLEIEAGDIEYDVTVEDCVGNERTDRDRTTRERTVRRDDNSDITIINIPNKPLPPTGGLPVHLMVGGSVLAGAGLLALRFATQRGHHR
jgi:hypothetical protein